MNKTNLNDTEHPNSPYLICGDEDEERESNDWDDDQMDTQWVLEQERERNAE